jgi:hypothetical protein
MDTQQQQVHLSQGLFRMSQPLRILHMTIVSSPGHQRGPTY